MFVEFLYALREKKVPVGTEEWLMLARALELGLHESSLDGFYRLARTICVKDVAHYDAFDAAFLETFRGVAASSIEITDQMMAWLADPARRAELTPEELAALEALDLEELRRRFEERLAEQKKRHDGGNKWVGTRGTSPFGAGGQNPNGIRVGDVGGGRSAMQVASERLFREYRADVVLDVRKIDVALRLLRDLGREGAPEELDLDETIAKTAKNAGELEVIVRPPRRNRAKVLLLMDVGGSMDPYAELVSRLFTAASRNGRFARFRAFYFHNCIYDCVYEDARFFRPVQVNDLLTHSDRDEKLVVVGDASMHPGELLDRGGSLYYYARNATPGIDWLKRLNEHFRRSVWLNPEPVDYWRQRTIQLVKEIFPMYPLTIEGLAQAVTMLVRGGRRPD